MTNMNDPKADYGIVTNEWKNSSTAAGAGAGANANLNSTVDVTAFVESDTLAELVWSPRTGLRIKLAEKKPCFMLEVGPSKMGFETQDQKDINNGGGEVETPRNSSHVERCGKMDKDPFHENAQESTCFQEKNKKREVESMESCKSGTEERKRRLCFEEQKLILGSKSTKKRAHKSMVNKDHSFMNWISNMMKGLKEHENFDHDETHGFETQKMGFRNVFQSLLLPDMMENKSTSLEIGEKEAKGHVSLYERVTKEAPKGMFDTIRRLRLSRTDILKWTNSHLSVAHLDGFFVRLRVAKWEEGTGRSRYYVACVTGLQGENQLRGLKQPIRVKVGGVECFVESQYVSNCDFLEEELITWWQKTSKNGEIPGVKDLKSKLAERRILGL